MGRDILHADVVIVGAGMSGLTAAHRLLAAGKRVAVVEARERVGGRVYGVASTQGVRVDLGAQWLGRGHTRMHALVQSLGLATTPTHQQGDSFYNLMGRLRRVPGGRPPVGPLGLVNLALLLRKMKREARLIDPERPWASPNALRLDSITMATFLKRHCHSRRVLAYWQALLEESMCEHTAEFSALEVLWGLRTMGTDLMYELGTAEESYVVGGTAQIPERLAETLRDQLYLGQPVREIAYDDDGAQVVTADLQFRCRRVIVAMPPVLSARIRYTPALPGWRDQLTQRVAQGSVLKWVAVYDQPFWRGQGLSGRVMAGGLLKGTMDVSPPDASVGLLAGFVTGADVRALGRRTDSERKLAILAEVGAYFGPAAREPVDFLAMDWTADPWARGGYAGHFAAGALTQYGAALCEPVGPLHWAGTETATVYRLYMEGAVQSGERAAAEVRAALG